MGKRLQMWLSGEDNLKIHHLSRCPRPLTPLLGGGLLAARPYPLASLNWNIIDCRRSLVPVVLVACMQLWI
eukprot:9167183-Karenia_brevis.AAC.1